MDKTVTSEAVGQRYVKTPDGAVYGPVDVVTLCSWAADARVIPGCCVSRDGKNWTPAESIPELRLNWVVRLSDGTEYGPLNLLAVWTLMLEGNLQRGMDVVERDGSRRLRVDDTLLPVLVEESRILLAGTGKLATELMGVIQEWRRQDQGALEARDGRVRELQDRLVKTEEELAAHVKLVEASQRYLAEREQVAIQADEKIRENESLRSDMDAARRLLGDSQRQVLEAARNLEDGRKRQAEMAAQMDKFRTQAAEGEKRQKEWAERIAAAEEEARKLRTEVLLAVEREQGARQNHDAIERELRGKVDELCQSMAAERGAREKAEADKQAGIEALKGEIAEWETRFRQVLEDVGKFDALLRKRDAEMAEYRQKAGERETEMASRLLSLRREADSSGRRTQELKEHLALAQRQTAEARKEAVEVERRLREQMESVQRDLSGIMLAHSGGRPGAGGAAPGGAGGISWLDGAPVAGEGAAAPAEAAGVPEQDLAHLQAALKNSTEEKQSLRFSLDGLRKSHEEFKKDTQSRVTQLQQDVRTTATMLQQALSEVEQREAQLRVMRKKAEDREAELLQRIEELEAGMGRTVVVEPEVLKPGEPHRTASAAEPGPAKGAGLLNTVEAQLRSELKKWETMSQAGNGKPKTTKWFRRK